MPSLRYSHY